MIRIQIQGVNETKLRLEQVTKEFREVVADTFEVGSAIIEGEAHARAPIGDPIQGRYGTTGAPGELRASIGRNVSEDGLRADVGTGKRYARWVEFATVDTPAQPFLYPAFRVGVKYIRKQLRTWGKAVGQKIRTRTRRADATRGQVVGVIDGSIVRRPYTPRAPR